MSRNAFSLIIFLGYPPLIQAQSSPLVTFQAGSATTPRSINNQGQIAGFYTAQGSTFSRGFLRAADGSIQTVLLPGTLDTAFYGINDKGDVVGVHDAGTRAFLRAANGMVTEIPVTDAVLVAANGINNDGFIVGTFQRAGGTLRAFLRNLANDIVPLAEIYDGDLEGVAIANGTNQIVLMRKFAGARTIYTNPGSGSFPPLVPNLPGATFFDTYVAHGVNSKGLIVGEVGNKGFLLRSSTDGVIFNLPNALSTTPYGLNDQNQIVGVMNDAGGQSGFLLNPCSPVLPQNSRSHGSRGEAGSIDFQADGSCLWIADGNVPWIHFSRSIGTGSGSLLYTLDPNSGAERQGKITIGLSEFAITQAAVSCTYIVSPLFPQIIPPVGGSFSVTITTSAGCPWSVFSPDPWIHLSSRSGTGTTTLTAQVDAAPAEVVTARTSMINVAGSPIPVTQSPLPCDFQFSRTSVLSPAEGSLENIRITVRPQCSWTPSIIAPWISPIGPYYQNQGSGTLSLSIAPNPGPADRTAMISVGNFSISGPLPTITVTQRGTGACSYSLQNYSYPVQAEGVTTYFSVITGNNCPFTAVSDVPWILIVPPPPYQTSAVGYQVLPNSTPFPRRGTIKVAGLSFPVDQLGSTSVQLGFVPLPSCRVMDTRLGQGFSNEQGPPALIANQVRSLGTAGRCNVPGNARAVALNIVALPVNPFSYLTVWSNGPRPEASTLNSFNGRAVSNMAVVPSTYVNIFASDSTNLVMDVIGYFADTALNSLVLYPVTPCRVFDTRTSNTPLVANVVRDVPVTGRCGIPANAAALSLNGTTVTKGKLDFLTLWPTGSAQPPASPVSLTAGQVAANASLLAAGTGGNVSVVASQDTDFVLDVNGYFALPSDAGLYFYPVNPCRITDTRLPAGGPALSPGVTRAFLPSAVPACGIPASARAHMVNATVVPPAPLAFLSLFPAPAWTGSSTLNAFDGQVTANFAIVPDNGQGIGAVASGPANLVLDISGYFAPVPASLRRPVPLPVP